MNKFKLRPYKVSEYNNQKLEILYNPDFIEIINNFLIFRIFVLINLAAAVGEFIAVQMGELPSNMIYIPLLHFIFLLFPLFIHSNRPAYSISISGDKIILKKKKFVIGFTESIIKTGNIDFLEINSYAIKGWHKADINAVLKNKKNILLFRLLIEQDAEVTGLHEMMNHVKMVTNLDVRSNL